jgi:hypothetical protein
MACSPRDNARLDQPMGQEFRDPLGLGVGRLTTRPPPRWRMAHHRRECAGPHVRHRWPIAPRALHGRHRTGLLGTPCAHGSLGAICGRTRAHVLDHRAICLDIPETVGQTRVMDVNPPTHRRHHGHVCSLPPPSGRRWPGTMGLRRWVPCPRVIDNARLVGVPQAGRTDELPGCHPDTRDVLDPASLPPCDTAEDMGAQPISSGSGVETPPTWTINLTTPFSADP